MSNSTDLSRRIRSIFENRLQIAIPSDASDLFETGLMDSLTLVDLLSEIEREFAFRLTLTDIDIDSFRSIQRISDFVAAQTRPMEAVVGTNQIVS